MLRRRIRIEPEPGRVVVRLDGKVLADTRRALRLEERGHRPRWYVPEADLRADAFAPSDHTSRCPFKGQAVYRSARAGSRVEEDVAWSYPDPLPDVAQIAGHWAFYDERVELDVEGR